MRRFIASNAHTRFKSEPHRIGAISRKIIPSLNSVLLLRMLMSCHMRGGSLHLPSHPPDLFY